MTDLRLRKVETRAHPDDAYRVIFEGEEIGSIGTQFRAGPDPVWRWAIDTVLPKQDFATDGYGADLDDCKRQFREAWRKLSRNPERLEEFMSVKRAAKRPWVK